MKIKILEYNILNGLCNEQPPYDIDKKRENAFIEVIKREKPDILLLCEACCWPFAEQTLFKDYGNVLSSIYSHCNSKDFRWAPAIFSRFPVEAKNLSRLYKSFVRASIGMNGKSLNVDVVHPNPALTEIERQEFFKEVLKSRKEPYVIAGDFNSLHPGDGYDPEKMIRGYQVFMGERGEAKARDILKATALKPLLEHNLIDTQTIRDKGVFTVPTDWRNKNKDSAVRLDYIFCSEELKVIDSGIIKDELTDKASDHYPIFAVLQI